MVREVLGHSGSSMTSAEIDLLFRALDSNKCAAVPGAQCSSWRFAGWPMPSGAEGY